MLPIPAHDYITGKYSLVSLRACQHVRRLFADISQPLQSWMTSTTPTCECWRLLLLLEEKQSSYSRLCVVFAKCSHVKVSSTEQVMGFSESNRIGALLIALPPELVQAAAVLAGGPAWRVCAGLLLHLCESSGHLSSRFLFLPLPSACRCVRTKEGLANASHVTSSALTNVGVVITRRLAELRYSPLDLFTMVGNSRCQEMSGWENTILERKRWEKRVFVGGSPPDIPQKSHPAP